MRYPLIKLNTRAVKLNEQSSEVESGCSSSKPFIILLISILIAIITLPPMVVLLICFAFSVFVYVFANPETVAEYWTLATIVFLVSLLFS
jgi:hypothetical protein